MPEQDCTHAGSQLLAPPDPAETTLLTSRQFDDEAVTVFGVQIAVSLPALAAAFFTFAHVDIAATGHTCSCKLAVDV